MSSIFTKIVQGDIPCHKVWEDEDHLAFLDINPLSEGHTLVIPKREHDDLFTLSPRRAEALWRAAHTVAARLREVVSCERIATLVLGYEVPHAHIHLIPTTSEAQVLRPQRQATDHAALAALATRLRGEGAQGGEVSALPTTSAIEARWDEFAARFVSHIEPITLRAAHAAIDQLKWSRARRVLEVGCGGGGAGVELKRRLDEALQARGEALSEGEVVLTDLSHEMVKLARESVIAHGLEGVEVCRADAQSLPFEAGRFDTYLACLNLMLVPDPRASLAEAARVLSQEAVAAWVVWGRPSHSPMMTLLPQAAARVGLTLPTPARSNFHLGGIDTLRELLSEAGFVQARLWYHQMSSDAETGEQVAEMILSDRPEVVALCEDESQLQALRATLASLAQERLDEGEPIGLDTLIAVARRG